VTAAVHLPLNNGNSPVAVVTGGSRGIGRAIAVQLARDGYSVAFCHQSADGGGDVEQAIRDLGCPVFHDRCDVSRLDDVKRFLGESEQRLGPIEVLVNNAGIIRDKPLVFLDCEAWQQVIDVNLTGTFNLCRAVILGFMKRRRRCIVNISSIAGIVGNAAQTNYSASKAGMIGFTKALAKEVGAYGIRVNAVAPGFIQTDMTDGLPEAVRRDVLKRIALKRFGTAQDVADLVSFLASDRAAYITGQTFQVDGGIVL
jgi:3-oxoacyl-[acyl-carrier protein] reductase